MFLKPAILNKLMKEAYKTGLKVSRDHDDWIYLAGEYWRVDIKKNYISKRTMGDLITLVGELPEKGTGYTATKEGNQMELLPELETGQMDYPGELEITDVLLIGSGGTMQRLLQDPDTGKIYPVNEVFMKIVSNEEVKASEGEYTVYAPNYHPNLGILWQNNVCRLRAPFRRDIQNTPILAAIAGADITRKGEA